MSPLNPGSGSRLVLDRCASHGIWLNSGELPRLRIWWQATGSKTPGAIDRLIRRAGPSAVAGGMISMGADLSPSPSGEAWEAWGAWEAAELITTIVVELITAWH